MNAMRVGLMKNINKMVSTTQFMLDSYNLLAEDRETVFDGPRYRLLKVQWRSKDGQRTPYVLKLPKLRAHGTSAGQTISIEKELTCLLRFRQTAYVPKVLGAIQEDPNTGSTTGILMHYIDGDS